MVALFLPVAMEYAIKLSLKAIVRAEQMLGKPFNDIDYNHEDDVMKLFYCAVLTNNRERFTFEDFASMMASEGFMESLLRRFEKEVQIHSQFITSQVPGERTGDKKAAYISELAGNLIAGGMDANYVMNEMELCDIPFLMDALDRKRKEDMESQRLWTFYSILPHVDTKKIKDPSDLIVFPWEQEAKRKKAEAEAKKNERLFYEFMGEYGE